MSNGQQIYQVLLKNAGTRCIDKIICLYILAGTVNESLPLLILFDQGRRLGGGWGAPPLLEIRKYEGVHRTGPESQVFYCLFNEK